MAKNNTATKSITSNSAARLAEIRAKKEAARKLLAELAQEETKEKESLSQEVADKIATLPELFGVADLGAVWGLFREFRAGLTSGSGKGRSSIPDDVKKQIVDLMKAAKAPGATAEEAAAGAVSALAERFGINYQNVRNLGIREGVIVPVRRETV